MSVVIEYEDITPNIKTDSGDYTSTDKQEYVDLSELKQENNLFPNYALCLPYYSLIGTAINAPSTEEWEHIGYVSNSMSDENGDFDVSPVIERTLSANYSGKGITLTFNSTTEDYCNSINIKWYHDATILADEDYTPDESTYFCEKEVVGFNKVVITLKSTNKPYRYAWLTNIEYGIIRKIKTDEAKKINVLTDISPISEELPIGTMTVELIPKGNIHYMFQKTQKIKLLYNNELIGTYYIDEAKQTKANAYSIRLQDAIGILSQKKFAGGIYINEPLINIINDISILCNIEFEVAEEFLNATITGQIDNINCRDVVCQLCMSIGAVANCYGTTKVRIFKLNEISQRTIDVNSQFLGVKVAELNKATEVVLNVFDWQKDETLTTLVNRTGTSAISGTYDYTSEEPYGDYVANSYVTINSSTANSINYTINITSGTQRAKIQGYKYLSNNYSISKKNPDVIVGDLENVMSVTNLKLVNAENCGDILNRVYDYYLHSRKITSKIVLGDNKIGDNVDIVCGDMGTYNGNIISMNMSITNSSIVAEVVII